VDIPVEQRNLLSGVDPAPEDLCRAYEAKIARLGGIDLFVGGIGEDGHLAFNMPGSSLTSRTRVVKLSEDTRRVNVSL
jgi:glucosamine-6-phosphate deaminase